MANQADKAQLEAWADSIDRAGVSASASHGRVLATVAAEMRAVAAGDTTVADLAKAKAEEEAAAAAKAAEKAGQ